LPESNVANGADLGPMAGGVGFEGEDGFVGKEDGVERVPGGEVWNGRGGQRIPADESKVGVVKECAARLLGEDESVGRVTGAWQRGLNPFLRRVRGGSAF